MEDNNSQSKYQKFFLDLVLGTLIYAVVLGFFEDYTNIINTWSYSITFMVAVVMQLLTYATFWLKSQVVKKFKGKKGKKNLAALIFGIWIIMFISKFIFLATIDIIFGNSVEISGFIGLILIILSMTLFKKFIDSIYKTLGNY